MIFPYDENNPLTVEIGETATYSYWVAQWYQFAFHWTAPRHFIHSLIVTKIHEYSFTQIQVSCRHLVLYVSSQGGMVPQRKIRTPLTGEERTDLEQI